jgi:predicted dehydrogenase
MPLRLGQIGLGAWGKNLLRTFSGFPDVSVVRACDIDPAQTTKLAGAYPKTEFTCDPRVVLDDPAIEAVVIATPPAVHFETASKALESGKDVFVEKPLVLSIDDGRRLLEIADHNERILMVGHIMEYHPASLKLKEFIDGGKLGKIHYLYSTRVNLGKVRDIENSLWSFAPHDISLIVFLLGQMPVRVTATGEAYLQKNIQDVVFMTMHFADKTMAHIHVSWLDPHKERNLTVVGSKMMAVFDDTESSEKIWLYDKSVETRLDYNTYGEYLSLRAGDILIPRVDSAEPLKIECQHFVDCVKTRTQPRSDGRDGLRVLTILSAAQKSMEQGGAPMDIFPNAYNV